MSYLRLFQILASSAKNMLLLGIGMTLGFPTVVIGALHMYTNSNGQVRNVTDPYGLTFNDHQAAWFGKTITLCRHCRLMRFYYFHVRRTNGFGMPKKFQVEHFFRFY